MQVSWYPLDMFSGTTATLVLMAMCRSGDFSLFSAWMHLRACRRQLALNSGFVKQVNEREREREKDREMDRNWAGERWGGRMEE